MQNESVSARFWWLFLVAGILSISAGVISIVYPHITLGVIAIVLGLYLVISGLIELVAGIAEDDADGTLRILAVLLGIVSLIAGVIVLRNPGESLQTISLVVGIFLIIGGVIEVFRAFGRPDQRGIAIFSGLIELAAGIIIAAQPKIGLTTLAVIIGIVLILRGIAACWLAFQVKKFQDPVPA